MSEALSIAAAAVATAGSMVTLLEPKDARRLDAATSPSAPYPGLRPFEPYEAEIFFGRESHVDALIARLKRTHFLAVFGPSGCGKSSLVRAGLVPGLELGLMAPEGADWKVAIMRPGDRPFSALAEELLKSQALGDQPRTEGDVFLLEAELRRGPLGLVHARQSSSVPKGANLLLVVDQFEEIFRFRREKSADDSDAFVELLLRSARERDAGIFVVITLRSDFIGHCAVFQGLPEAINDSQYLTPRLTRDQCEAAIAGPARVFGGIVDPLLLNTLLNEFGTDPDQLPVLQHALMRMWNRAQATSPPGKAIELNTKHYEKLGNMSAALSAHANERYMEAERRGLGAVTEVMFKRLSERTEDGREVRAPATVKEIAEIAGVEPARVVEVADLYRSPDCCFLMPPSSQPLTPETKLDISHESLIRQWDKLAAPDDGWLQRESTMAQLFRYLSRRAAQQTRAKRMGAAPVYLEGDDLVDAKDWLSREGRHPRWAQRYVPPGVDFNKQHAEVVDYVRASEANEQQEQQAREEARKREAEFQRQRLLDAERVAEEQRARLADREKNARTMKTVLFVLVALSFAMIGVTFFALKQAQLARTEELNTQARGYWDALELTTRELTPQEGNNLLRLSKSERRVRERFLELGLSEPVFARRLVKRPVEIIDAATGLSLDVRQHVRERVLGAPAEPAAPDDIALARGLALLALEDPAPVREIVELKKKKSEGTAGPGLAATIVSMPAEQAGRVAPTLSAAIRATKDPNHLTALSAGLAAIAPGLPEQQLVSLSETLIGALSTVDDPRQLTALVSGLRAGASKISGPRLGALTDSVINAIKTSDSVRQTPALGSALAALARNLPEPQLATVADTLVAGITSLENTRQLAALQTGLTAMAPKLPGPQAARMADRLLAAMKNTNEPRRRAAIERAFAAIVPGLPDTQAPAIAEALLAMFTAAPDSDPPQDVRVAFEAALRKLPDAQVSRTAETLIGTIKGTKNQTHAVNLGVGLAAIAPKLPPEQLVSAADTLLALIKMTESPPVLSSLGAGLAAIVPRLPEASLTRSANAIVAAMKDNHDSDQVRALNSALAAALPALPPSQLIRMGDAVSSAMKAAGDMDNVALAKALVELLPQFPQSQQGAAADILLKSINATVNRQILSLLGPALSGIVAKLPEPQSSRTTDAIIATLGRATDIDQARALGDALAAAPKLTRAQLSRMVGAFSSPGMSRGRDLNLPPAMGMAIRETRESSILAGLSSSITLIAPKLSTAQAVSVEDALFAAMKSTTDSGELSQLRAAFAAVAPKLPASEPSRLADLLVPSLKATTDPDQLEAYGGVLTILLPALSEAQLKRVTESALAAMQTVTDLDQLSHLRSALEKAAAKLPDRGEALAAQTLPEILKNTKERGQIAAFTAAQSAISQQAAPTPRSGMDTLMSLITSSKDSNNEEDIAAAFGKTVPTLSKSEATRLADEFLATIAASDNAKQLAALGPPLATVLSKVPDVELARFTAALIGAIAAKESGRRLPALTAGLSAIAARVPEQKLLPLANQLLAAMSAADDSREIGALGAGLAALARRTDAPPQLLPVLVEAMKYPTGPRADLVQSLRKTAQAAPHSDRGFTAFLAWLKAASNVDLEAPPK